MARPLSQTSRQHRPSGPDRRRNRWSMKALIPGALPGSGTDGADVTRQRVSAALGTGSPPTRNRKAVTPEVSAASASRRLAVRSSSVARPCSSTTSAPRPAQRNPSTAARSSMASSAIVPSSRFSGATPSAARPGPKTTPPARCAAAVRNQSKGASRAASRPRINANPAAAPSSGAPNSSCTRPRASPPSNARSKAPDPVATRPPAFTAGSPSSDAICRRRVARDFTDSITPYVPDMFFSHNGGGCQWRCRRSWRGFRKRGRRFDPTTMGHSNHSPSLPGRGWVGASGASLDPLG